MSEDLIKREDAIKVIKDNSFAPGVDYLEINGYGAIDDIRALPSADRPQGEWMWHEEDEDICNCSECEFEIDATGCIDPMEYVGVFRYCPNCGAKMKGADDE